MPLELDERKQTLLEAIVINYVDRAEPVGSTFLASLETLKVRSATIRSELAEMTDLGLLRQPHTSAGRVPSDQGYRFYVDHLMPDQSLNRVQMRKMTLAHRAGEGDLEQLLAQTCRILTALTSYTAVASPPASDSPVFRQVQLALVAERRLLIVVVLAGGQVVHRLLEIPAGFTLQQIQQASNRLAALLEDQSAARATELRGTDYEAPPGCRELLDSVLGQIAQGLASEAEHLFIEGASRVLDQPEFRDGGRAEPIVRFLEERRTALQLLSKVMAQRDVAISIGSENPVPSLHEISLVIARYGAGGSSSGWVGVLGPTRMQYAQAAAAVRSAAAALTTLLAQLELA